MEVTAKTAQHTPVKNRLVKYCVQAIQVAHSGERTIPPLSQFTSLMVKNCSFLVTYLPARITPIFQAPVLPKGQRWEGGMTWALSHSNERGTALSLSKLACSNGRTVKVLIVLTILIRFAKRLGGSCNNLKIIKKRPSD